MSIGRYNYNGALMYRAYVNVRGVKHRLYSKTYEEAVINEQRLKNMFTDGITDSIRKKADTPDGKVLPTGYWIKNPTINQISQRVCAKTPEGKTISCSFGRKKTYEEALAVVKKKMEVFNDGN